MFPEDRVLVGVINRKKDLQYAREAHWYRIPQTAMPRGVNAEYLAIFLSGKIFKEQSGGIHYFAPIIGLELVYRRDLLPDEAHHARADGIYYRVAIDSLKEKQPPILNTDRRSIAFIYTTWDRFVHATHIRELYSTADYFVDRIYHALRNTGVTVQRAWDAEKSTFSFAPGLHILCENGAFDVSTLPGQGKIHIDMQEPQDKILAAIHAEIDKQGGTVTTNKPMKGL